MNDWRKAIRAPIAYSVPGSSSTLIRQQTNFVIFVVIIGAFTLLTLFTFVPISRSSYSHHLDEEHGHKHENSKGCELNKLFYNHTYPLTPIETLSDGSLSYRIAAIADLDKKSRVGQKEDKWKSYVLLGSLVFNPDSNSVVINWNDEEKELTSSFSSGGRGMELSDLVVFNGKLYTCDDRTGIVYEMHGSILMPWVILRNGDGLNTSKGFKCEWMVVKDEQLYVGGLGKEWTSATGNVVLNHDPQWVKRITSSGVVEHLDWRAKYDEIKSAVGYTSPGYLIHEAAVWSDTNNCWYFLPRRASQQRYDEQLDEQRGTNIIITADSNFTNVTLFGTVGPLIATHGFSSVKLLPLPSDLRQKFGKKEIAIALKSEESADIISTFVIVFSLPDRQVLLKEKQISSKHKYEGIEFV